MSNFTLSTHLTIAFQKTIIMKGQQHMLTASQPIKSEQAANQFLIGLCIAFGTFWITCFAGTADLINWYIENILVVMFVILMAATYRRFRFSMLSYLCFFIFLCLHTYGAKYAYADNVFGLWLQNKFHLWRNPYDRIVHTSFGLLMVYPIRDLFTRQLKLSAKIVWFLPIELILSLAGLFELVEWAIADVFFPAHGKSYVGTQGDVWDAQKDMVVALGGAIVATGLLLLVRKNRAVFIRFGLMGSTIYRITQSVKQPGVNE